MMKVRSRRMAMLYDSQFDMKIAKLIGIFRQIDCTVSTFLWRGRHVLMLLMAVAQFDKKSSDDSSFPK